MATQTGSETASKSTLGKVALPAAVAAAGAGIGLLFTLKPKRLRDAIPDLPGGAGDLIGQLRQRVAGQGSTSAAAGAPAGGDSDPFEARRRERKERRERRRQHATT